MFYVKDGVYPYTVTDFRIANPGISMRADPEPEVLAEFGMFPVAPSPQPPFDPITQDCTRAAELQGGAWVEVWTVTNASQDAVAARLHAKRAGMVVSPRQARLALLGAGKLAAVNTALASLPSPQKEAAQIDWEYATAIERNSPLISQLGPALGMTDAQIDALFEAAAAL